LTLSLNIVSVFLFSLFASIFAYSYHYLFNALFLVALQYSSFFFGLQPGLLLSLNIACVFLRAATMFCCFCGYFCIEIAQTSLMFWCIIIWNKLCWFFFKKIDGRGVAFFSSSSSIEKVLIMVIFLYYLFNCYLDLSSLCEIVVLRWLKNEANVISHV
jgi:hypothetical protein